MDLKKRVHSVQGEAWEFIPPRFPGALHTNADVPVLLPRPTKDDYVYIELIVI